MATLALAAALASGCTPRVPADYAQECLRLVRETPRGSEIHEVQRPRWVGTPEEGKGPIQFDFGHLAGQREVEYHYVSHYIDVGDISVPIYATATRMVGYGPRYRAVCRQDGDRTLLDGIEETGEWEGGL